jgi:hypothetical protein
MGWMSNRSSIRRELRVLGSFRNSAHRQQAVGSFRNSAHPQEAVGSFRKSVASALQSSVYEIFEIDLVGDSYQFFQKREFGFSGLRVGEAA